MNEFFVGLQGDNIVFLKSIPPSLTKEQAIALAAWIVALADDDMGSPNGTFAKKLEEVLAT